MYVLQRELSAKVQSRYKKNQQQKITTLQVHIVIYGGQGFNGERKMAEHVMSFDRIQIDSITKKNDRYVWTLLFALHAQHYFPWRLQLFENKSEGWSGRIEKERERGGGLLNRDAQQVNNDDNNQSWIEQLMARGGRTKQPKKVHQNV